MRIPALRAAASRSRNAPDRSKTRVPRSTSAGAISAASVSGQRQEHGVGRRRQAVESRVRPARPRFGQRRQRAAAPHPPTPSPLRSSACGMPRQQAQQLDARHSRSLPRCRPGPENSYSSERLSYTGSMHRKSINIIIVAFADYAYACIIIRHRVHGYEITPAGAHPRAHRPRAVTSQEQLRERLRARGFEATQATLSRDIRDLGLIKRAADGAYRRAGRRSAPGRATARPAAHGRREYLRASSKSSSS